MMHGRMISGEPCDFGRRPQRPAGLLRTTEAVGLIVRLASMIAVGTHRAVAPVVINSSRVRMIDRQMHMIGSKAVPMGIAVGEQAALQHLVGGGTDAGHEVRRI